MYILYALTFSTFLELIQNFQQSEVKQLFDFHGQNVWTFMSTQNCAFLFKKCRKAIHFCWKAVNFNSSVFCTHLSIEMQTTILLDRKRPKMRKNEQTRQRISPAHHETVIAQMISRGIMKKVTWKRKIDEISQKTTNLENWHRC